MVRFGDTHQRGDAMNTTTDAADREFDRKIQKASVIFVAVFVLAGVYSLLALLGFLPIAPWAPAAK